MNMQYCTVVLARTVPYINMLIKNMKILTFETGPESGAPIWCANVYVGTNIVPEWIPGSRVV